MTRFFFILFIVTLPPYLTSAKRIAAAEVEPVIHGGIRYVAPNDDGRRAHIEAWDVQTNRKLWDLTVFTNPVNPKLEEDVQWVFINKLSVRDSTLLVTSERSKRYEVDLKTRSVTRSEPSSLPAPHPTSPPHDIPEVINRVVTNGLLGKDYELSFRVNPFYLGGDFNGDSKADIAVLVKQRSTGKLGIAIVHGAGDKVTILGAGTPTGNAGDDFEWMDSWGIYTRERVASGTSAPKLHGDALLVSKSESASALIYWNGKRYIWLQQGD